MNNHHIRAMLLAFVLTGAAPSAALAADYHHVHLSVPSPSEAVKWYAEHMECQPIADRDDATNCGSVEISFGVQPVLGGSQGTGVNHIGFSFPDLEAKMLELEDVGVRGSGVRLQRFDDGALFHDVPGLFKLGFVFDPWGTRIELVEDPETLGFHHVHLSSADPAATLAWYGEVFGGEPARLAGRIDGLRFGDVWLLVSPQEDGLPAPTEGRTIDHLGFVVPDLDSLAAELGDKGVELAGRPAVPANARGDARRAFLMGPDNVRVAVVETGWAGVDTKLASAAVAETREPYDTPRTPWGAPDLQGIWTGDAAHGIPLERPLDAAEIEALTPEQAAARRERGTLASIWGYEREWRDTTLGYASSAPSTQVAMVIDPEDGRLPPLTAEAEARLADADSVERGLPAGPEDLSSWVRCITRGLPGMMIPSVYNNGLQIVQGPGFVAIQKEMIHETRVIPTDERAHLGSGITQWLGDSRGRWDGDTLVVEVTNFNGRSGYRGAGEAMTLTERWTRVGPTSLEYRFTVDDPTIWTSPWTGMFYFERDDSQYELVEYACHEGNYGMRNILSGARAEEQAAETENQ
jgi:catechol 2,3-dioxygenase-like lactoylglutathione lyase family enzyme